MPAMHQVVIPRNSGLMPGNPCQKKIEEKPQSNRRQGDSVGEPEVFGIECREGQKQPA